MLTKDTIVAVATPSGAGGLAVLRVSGPEAFAIADRVFRPSRAGAGSPSLVPSHSVHHGHVWHAGRAVDEVLLTVFRGPGSYTREEIGRAHV